MCIAVRNAKEPQAGYLVASGTRTMRYSTHFYTNAHVLAPFVTFYNAKLQLIKTPVEGKPNTISPNHTYMTIMFITNTKLQHKPESFFHCTLPLKFKIFWERSLEMVSHKAH